MSRNAQWNVEGAEVGTGNYIGVYLSSPDLTNIKEARKRAAAEAKRRWAKLGLKVSVVNVRCVG